MILYPRAEGCQNHLLILALRFNLLCEVLFASAYYGKDYVNFLYRFFKNGIIV
jgi:hypothetical protein